MDQIPKLPPLQPSTPPFLNASPDLRSLKSFFKSPDQYDAMENIADMDFESAYALLTQSPTFNLAPTPSQIPAELKELFASKTPSPRLGSPLPSLDLGQLQNFTQEQELLSVNETNALEKFLDSIIEDKQHKEMSLDSSALMSEGSTLAPPSTVLTASTSDAGVDTSREGTVFQPIPMLTQYTLGSSVSPEPEMKRTHSQMSDEEQKATRKKKKLLTAEEKKMNHTVSEQRRRELIKESLERLISVLPLDQKKKRGQAKAVVLETAARQLERLKAANQAMTEMLNQQP